MHCADSSGTAFPIPKKAFELPSSVIPRHYDITLQPDFKKFTFDGTVLIDVDILEDTNSISLNTLDLDIHSTHVLAESHVVRCVTYTHPAA